MHLPPLRSPSMTHYCISGDVSIAPDAAIAAGSVLKADEGCAIVIGAGACVGLGAVLHANDGSITVEAGASLGAGTVVVGHCCIGAQACVGTSTTIYNVSVAPRQLVPPASLLGNVGRVPDSSNASEPSADAQETGRSSAPDSVVDTTEKRNRAEASTPKAAKMDPEPSPWDEVEPEAQVPSDSAGSNAAAQTYRAKTVVYGRAQFEQMKSEMFSR